MDSKTIMQSFYVQFGRHIICNSCHKELKWFLMSEKYDFHCSKTITDNSRVYTFHSVVYMINLTPNVMNKPEWHFFIWTRFCNVTFNNSSSGLKENVILTNTYLFWHQNYDGKFGAIMKRGGMGGKSPLERTILTNKMCVPHGAG